MNICQHIILNAGNSLSLHFLRSDAIWTCATSAQYNECEVKD